MEIGYACKIIGVPDVAISSCTLKNCTKQRLLEIIDNNLIALDNILDYNMKMGITLFRISSDIIPFGSHIIMSEINWREIFKDGLNDLGEKIEHSKTRVSMHPGQYTVLNSINSEVVKKSINDIQYHCDFLDSLNTSQSSKVVIHIGGIYGNKEASIERFINVFEKLPKSIKKRIVIENDDKCFNIADVLYIGNHLHIPVVFDNLHHKLNPPQFQMEDISWIKKASVTWSHEDGVQKIHYSQQKINGKRGSHSDTIDLESFLEFYNTLLAEKINVDIMLEVKDKNLSAVKCKNGVNDSLKIKSIEQEWAKYKYFVLGKSANLYNEIRQLLKNKSNANCLEFYKTIESALTKEGSIGSQTNSIQHIWGYVNKSATLSEKKRYVRLLFEYRESGKGFLSIKNLLFKMATKQNQVYLVNSLFFYL